MTSNDSKRFLEGKATMSRRQGGLQATWI